MGLTKEKAIKMSESKWWEGKTDEEIAEFQIHELKLCCPFDIFHKAVETWLGRPVWTHEFADPQALIDEKKRKKIRVCNTCSQKEGRAIRANLLCRLKRHNTELIHRPLWEQTLLAEQRETKTTKP